MEFAFYCHAINSHPYAYEKGSGKVLTACNCGTQAHTRIEITSDGTVKYYMSSNHHNWKLCTTSNKKATKFPYVIDESIYGSYCQLDLTLKKKVGGSWVDDKP